MSPLKLSIGLTVLLIIIGGVSVPLILGAPESDSWHYDDYRACGADTQTDGAFEVVDYDGGKYLHAKSTGIGHINGQEYTVLKSELTPILIWGQSNAAYSSGRSDVALVNELAQPISTQAYYYGSTSRPCALDQYNAGFSTANNLHSAINPDGTYRIGELESGIISAFCENTHGFRPYTINLAIPATSLEEWLPGGTYNNNLHSAWADAIADVDTAYYDLRAPIVVMAQGEADASTPPATYLEEFSKIHTDFKRLIHFESWWIIQTKKADGLYSSETQKTIATQYKDVFMGTTITQSFKLHNGMMSPDNLHYSQLGDYTAGYSAIESYLEHADPAEKMRMDMKPLLGGIVAILLIAALLVAATALRNRN